MPGSRLAGWFGTGSASLDDPGTLVRRHVGIRVPPGQAPGQAPGAARTVHRRNPAVRHVRLAPLDM